MRKIHDIVPSKKRFEKAMLRIRLCFWAKGFIACVRYDAALSREIGKWPDGFTFTIRVPSGEPSAGMQKNSQGLQFIRANQAIEGDVVLFFKSFAAAQDVFFGKTAANEVFAEGKLLLKGSRSYGVSVLRAVMLAQNILYPQLTVQDSIGLKCGKYIKHLKVCLKILFRKRAEEAILSDPKVLRIFE